MSYQFEILSGKSVQAVRVLGKKVVRTAVAQEQGARAYAKLVAKTDKQEQSQKAQLVTIMRPYVRKFSEDKESMHLFSKELKVAALGEVIATKKVAKRTLAEKRAYNAFARVQSDAAQELGIGAHSKSRGYTLPRGLRGEIESSVRDTLNEYEDCDFEYGVRVTRGSLTVSVSRVA